MVDKIRTIKLQFDREHKATVRFKTDNVDAPCKTIYLERGSKEAEGVKKWEGSELILTLEVTSK
jgi:hypothetical protein